MSIRQPKNFLIQISLDSDLNFSYKDLYSQMDARSITVIKGDQIGWILEPSIPERMLQIDFGLINPFHIYRNVNLRGRGHVVAADPVNFPLGYPGNRQLKYTAWLGNGLHDDPDVVPVEHDATLTEGLAVSSDFKISWTNTNPKYQAIAITPTDLSKSADGGKTAVTWKWVVGTSEPTPPFQLTFNSPPAGWPAETDSTDINPAITLLLTPGPETVFKITTSSGDGEKELFTMGKLTITA